MERMVAMNQDSEIMVYRISKVSPSTRNVGRGFSKYIKKGIVKILNSQH